MKAIILAGSDLRLTPHLRGELAGADFVVAADSGLRHAPPLGLVPDLIVGDFDSLDEETLAPFLHVAKEAHPVAKDALDLELALEHALAAGATELYLLGTLGGRFDQSLAALFIGARYVLKGCRVSLYGSDQAVHVLSGSSERHFALPSGQLFSLLSLGETAQISLKGAQFPLEHHPLPFGVGLGVSNRVDEPPLKIDLHEGLVALIIEYD